MSVATPLSPLERRYTKSTGKPTRHRISGTEVKRDEYNEAIEGKVYVLESKNKNLESENKNLKDEIKKRDEKINFLENIINELKGDMFVAHKCAEECLEMLDTDLTKGATNGQSQSQEANRQN